jgi:hypothetical protein
MVACLAFSSAPATEMVSGESAVSRLWHPQGRVLANTISSKKIPAAASQYVNLLIVLAFSGIIDYWIP